MSALACTPRFTGWNRYFCAQRNSLRICFDAAILEALTAERGCSGRASWMEVLAFIHPFRFLIGTGQKLTEGPVENLHPSEDGEALQSGLTAGRIPGAYVLPEVTEVTGGSRWFALYTTCRHEKRIAQHLVQREIEHYLPLYRADRKWRDGSRVTLELPLFPGYLFVRIKRSERVNVLSVPGALCVVGGTGGEPAPVPESAIEALRAGLEERRIEPHPLLRVGQMARIRSGSFAGMQGIVVRRKSGFRVVLTLEQIMQSIAVEVDEEDLEPLASSRSLAAMQA